MMHFTRVKEASSTDERRVEHLPAEKFTVSLTPGSLVLMSGEAH